MKKYFLFILLGLATLACKEQATDQVIKTVDSTENMPIPISPSANEKVRAEPTPAPKDVPVPAGYKLMDEALGDLNKDGQSEKAIVFDTGRPSPSDLGIEREIHIYKMEEGEWEIWHKSVGAALPSEHGGVMGDPFEGIDIENGSLAIHHFGGSRQKWRYTHRFRFQNSDWQLIGATVLYGSPCDYWENFDYNLSTGKIIYKKETEACDENDEILSTATEDKEFKNKLKSLPSMDGFYPGANEIKIPDTETTFYY